MPVWYKSSFFLGGHLEKKSRFAGHEIFLRFEVDLDFSRPWFSEIKVQIRRPLNVICLMTSHNNSKMNRLLTYCVRSTWKIEYLFLIRDRKMRNDIKTKPCFINDVLYRNWSCPVFKKGVQNWFNFYFQKFNKFLTAWHQFIDNGFFWVSMLILDKNLGM